MQSFGGGPTTPIEQVSDLGEGIIQKLVAAGITTVEGLADMTPEQLEEIPGIGEKTLEKISLAVRHYFEQLEQSQAGNEAAAAEESDEKPEGSAEVETPLAVVDTAETELENAADVLEEAEGVNQARAEEELTETTGISEDLAEDEAQSESLTAAEFAVENVPDADAEEITEAEEEGE
jgi:N utilization substance protein A